MNDMVFWHIGDDEKTNAWDVCWVKLGLNLSSMRNNLADAHQFERLADSVDENGERKLDWLGGVLPQNILDDMMVIHPLNIV